MTPAEISKLSDHELKWEIALKVGWRNLFTSRFDSPDGSDAIRGVPPGSTASAVVPNWPTDPAASAELRLYLWKRGAHIGIGWWDRVAVNLEVNSGRLGPWLQYEAEVVIGDDPIRTECRAFAEAALAALTEGKT